MRSLSRLGSVVLRAAVAFTFSYLAEAEPSSWWLARSAHFEIYSQSSKENARSALAHFEALRNLLGHSQIFEAPELVSGNRAPLRVIEFASSKEYDAFRSGQTADAYYLGSEARDYIVMPAPRSGDLSVAAHEYAHAALHAKGVRWPEWLSEGLAEVFSTIRVSNLQYEFGGGLPNRLETLKRERWLPLAELFLINARSPVRQSRSSTAVFYAESWAMADMLVFSPDYAPNIEAFFRSLNAGHTSERAFGDIYGKQLTAVSTDLRTWIGQNKRHERSLSPLSVAGDLAAEPSVVSEADTERVLADLLLSKGEWSRAEQTYRRLLLTSPNDPDLLAGLGTAALRGGNKTGALDQWRKAIESGSNDPALCYRFAVLADEAGLPPEEIARALKTAVASDPNFDDARYRLALLSSNQGDYEAAVSQLKAMRNPPPNRAYNYWSAMAFALTELGRRDEAVAAAREACQHATSSDERQHARALEYTAKTDLHVQFERDATGQLRLVTTRVLHGADWNPFIESGDRIERLEGQLRSVQCVGGKLVGFSIETGNGTLRLDVPDPTRVLMRNSPPEFSCGAQKARSVKVEYATSSNSGAGVLRGMEFR